QRPYQGEEADTGCNDRGDHRRIHRRNLVQLAVLGTAAARHPVVLLPTRVLRQAGIEPRSRTPREPNFDLAWQADGTVFGAEAKSITNDSEEEQLRLGLG